MTCPDGEIHNPCYCLCRLNGGQKPGEVDEGAAPTISALDRKGKALRKKIKQAVVLVERRKAGEKLTSQELEKVQKAAIW